MKIYKKILIIKKFTLLLCESDEILKREILNCNLRKVSFHLFKSDFLILIFVNLNIRLIYIFNKIFGKNFLIVYKFLFNFFYAKFKEILISSIFINNFNYTEKYQTKNFIQAQEYFDYIVLGSGPSGSITSYYLNKKFPEKTLLLEKGKDISNFNKKHPHEEFLKKWKNAGLNSTLFPIQIPFASGECLGGGSEINSGLFHKPSKKFMTSWEENYAFKTLSQEEINNHFKEINEITKSDKIKPLGKNISDLFFFLTLLLLGGYLFLGKTLNVKIFKFSFSGSNYEAIFILFLFFFNLFRIRNLVISKKIKNDIVDFIVTDIIAILSSGILMILAIKIYL